MIEHNQIKQKRFLIYVGLPKSKYKRKGLEVLDRKDVFIYEQQIAHFNPKAYALAHFSGSCFEDNRLEINRATLFHIPRFIFLFSVFLIIVLLVSSWHLSLRPHLPKRGNVVRF